MSSPQRPTPSRTPPPSGAGPQPVVAVTGANSGVGLAATRLLARSGYRVVMICRSRERGEEARRAVARDAPDVHPEPELVLADLADFASVREAAEEVAGRHPRLDAVVANAGLYLARRRTTEDGFEATMAVNHLGHYLLVRLLAPRVRAAGGRVVVVSSEAHRRGRLEREPLPRILRGDVDYHGFQAYADSKLANVLFAFELARREAREGTGVTSNALHPGMLATRIWNRNRNPVSLLLRLFKPFMGSPGEGGQAVLRLVDDPSLERLTGRYFDQSEETRAAEPAYDRDLAHRLWDVSARATGLEA